MTVEWIVPFQERLERVNEQFRTLRQIYPMTDEDNLEQRCLSLADRNLEQATEWAQSLVPEERAWIGVNASEMFHTNAARLAALTSSFEVLIRLADEHGRIEDPAMPLVRVLADETRAALITVQDRARERQHWISLETSLLAVPPLAAMTGILSTLSWLVKPAQPLDESMTQRLILYHPLYTYNLLVALINSLRRLLETRVIVTTHHTATHFEIKLTVQGLHLTPTLWEMIVEALNAIRNDANLELLYEIGGQLDPLTWDEGQGEGAIVRLPWADLS